jgi:biopolymer transport protein ExbD
MGMNTGEAKGGAMAEMNVVPLIDILLVLLIIFMVISPLVPKGLNTLLPRTADTPDFATPDSTVVVQVGQNGKLRINGEDTDWSALGLRIEQIFKDRGEKVVFVKGDDNVLFMDVARAIDILRESGIDKVGLMPGQMKDHTDQRVAVPSSSNS